MIQINNLVKKFDDFTALDGVNMNVEKGAVYGLVGPNGAGKSTFFLNINGVLKSHHGEIYYRGEKITKKNLNNLSAYSQKLRVYKKVTELMEVLLNG